MLSNAIPGYLLRSARSGCGLPRAGDEVSNTNARPDNARARAFTLTSFGDFLHIRCTTTGSTRELRPLGRPPKTWEERKAPRHPARHLVSDPPATP